MKEGRESHQKNIPVRQKGRRSQNYMKLKSQNLKWDQNVIIKVILTLHVPPGRGVEAIFKEEQLGYVEGEIRLKCKVHVPALQTG